MNRREFLNSALATAVVGGAMANQASAQQGRFPPGPPRPYPGTTRTLPLHASSRFLHWVRTPADVAKACLDVSCRSLMVTVQDDAAAHVQLSSVATQLPAFVRAVQAAGVDVKMVRGGNQTAVDPAIERLVGTMGELGITHYVLGTEQYDLAKPLAPQLDAIKRKIDVFVKLNERHGTTLLYDTRAGTNTVGAGVWDLVQVFQGFDPKRVGFNWDTGQMALLGPSWESALRAAAPNLAAISWTDMQWKQDLGGYVIEGGFFPGTVEAAEDGDGDGPGRAAGAGGRGGAAGGGAGGRAGGAAGGRGGAAGGGRAGGAPAASPLDGVPRPLAGTHFARGMGWSTHAAAIGTGMVNLFRYGQILGEINFTGMMSMGAEYEGLGGAELGRSTVTQQRRALLGHLKRDALTVRAALAQSGSGIMV